MTALQIREATDADLPGVLRVLVESGIDGGHSFTLDEARAHLAAIRQWPNFRLLAVERDGEIIGTYSLVIMDKLGKRGTPAGVVEDVAVLPAMHGQGVGRAMMEHALAECRKAGCYKLALSSNVKREGAHRFYESLGFERHGYSFAILLTIVLTVALLLASCGKSAPPSKRYAMHGQIQSVDTRAHSAMIAHDKIGDWMGAMTMEYPVKPDSELARLHPGDTIDATVMVSDDSYYVTDVKVKPR